MNRSVIINKLKKMEESEKASNVCCLCVKTDPVISDLLYSSGDEVVEWNGRSLQGKTFEEVYDIIFESKQESQVELIVQRPLR